MSAPANESRKRKRENEVKKWTDDDIKKVLNYMQANRNIEKPTARLYYKKLLEQTQINATWNTLKCKVRHLKGTLQKANDWCDSMDAEVKEDDGDMSALKDKILKICPHYDQLSDIFSSTVVMETSPDVFYYNQHEVTDNEDESITLSDDTITNPSAVKTFAADKVQRRTQNTCLENQSSIEIERIKFREKQLTLEKEKFEWTKEVEKKKLEMEKLKLEKEFELRKLELEQNERIKMYEIEMKYKK